MVWPDLAGISIFVAIRIAFVAGPAQNRRWRPRRLLVCVGGRLVSVAVRRWPAAPDTAIAVRIIAIGRAVAPVRIVAVMTAAPVRITAVVTAVAPVTIAPLDIFAFDIATLVDEARSIAGTTAPVTATRGATIVIAGRVAAAVRTGIRTVIWVPIVTSLRRGRVP